MFKLELIWKIILTWNTDILNILRLVWTPVTFPTTKYWIIVSPGVPCNHLFTEFSFSIIFYGFTSKHIYRFLRYHSCLGFKIFWIFWDSKDFENIFLGDLLGIIGFYYTHFPGKNSSIVFEKRKSRQIATAWKFRGRQLLPLFCCVQVQKELQSVKRSWTPKEIEVVLEKYQKHVVGSTLPGKAEWREVINNCEALSKRSWYNMKDYVMWEITK